MLHIGNDFDYLFERILSNITVSRAWRYRAVCEICTWPWQWSSRQSEAEAEIQIDEAVAGLRGFEDTTESRRLAEERRAKHTAVPRCGALAAFTVRPGRCALSLPAHNTSAWLISSNLEHYLIESREVVTTHMPAEYTALLNKHPTQPEGLVRSDMMI